MTEDPVTLHSGSSNPARELVAQGGPEGVLLAKAWKRAAAYILDWIVIMGVLALATRGTFVTWLYSLSELQQRPHIVAVHWLILLGLHFLYFKYTGRWMGRSLGQRWFRIALVHDDASPLGEGHWGRRSWRKSIYAVPVIGLLFFGVRDFWRIRGDEKHQSRVDLAEQTVAAVDWSLPPLTRATLR